ncbi:hypothetical protein KUTeg_006016 [Tegillarca granosa]|uniref:Ig-like domain-containing protein n=1 Tax=Tegillarca granosa TaxID=220873 RepID=A0ABQ9FJ98_TEGGR|nr:hypothetical protein KUTeg_006016 [Tegillarca granosa]
MAGQPFFISRGDNIVHGINIDIEGKWKYEINKIPGGSRVVYSLTIRGLEEEDAGLYMCRIRINGNNEVSVWPTKYAKLTVQTVGRPEIVGDILPTVTQINAEADLICAVVNDKIDDANVIEWVKARSASGQPIFISENDKVVDSAQQIIEETKKFKYEVRREKQESRDLYILTIRGLAEEDAGDYICRIRITGPNSPPSSWPQKVAQLTVQSYPTPTVTWQKLTNQGRVDIRDDDKYDLKTMECQGANCPSIGTGGGSAVTFSVTSLVLSAISVMFYL